jgi:7-keto-8-aminopelargonate synthetase-like enzyme
MNLLERWSAALGALDAAGRYRTLTLPGGVDFASNDYLGYASATPDCGAPLLSRSGSASRLLRGHQRIWEEVESSLADWHGAEAALLFTSGYAANEGLLSTIIEPHDWVASDERNHASIIDGLRLTRAERYVFRHNDLEHLATGLRQASRTRTGERQLFVVTEALFGMDGDAAPLVLLVELAERYGAHVLVDEAHSTGCFGPTGSGCVDAAGLRERVLATVHTGGKALAVAGGYVCGSVTLRELLINRCRHFMFTTALPPVIGTWWLEALARVRDDHAARAALHDGAVTFRSALSRAGMEAPGSHYVVPIILGDDVRTVRATVRLRERGWDIRAIRPPSVPPSSARLRVSVHANHERATLLAAAAAVAEVMRETL